MESTDRPGLTPEARRQLEQELAQLREQRAANAPPPDEWDAPGDSADQADVLERAEVTAWLDRRIADVTDMLARGTQPESALPDGTTVTLRYADGAEETLRVVAVAGEPAGNGQEGTLTSDSPLGRALTGHGAGDTITYRTPRGEVTAQVLAVEPPGR